jgi:hypothetical protein
MWSTPFSRMLCSAFPKTGISDWPGGNPDGRFSGGDGVSEVEEPGSESLYCPSCDLEVDDPLVCGDCGAVICRQCGTPLEKVDELGMG